MGKVETARVVGGGVGRIREGFHPRFESGSEETELDAVEKVHSGPRNPRLGNEATCLERGGFIVQMVDDEVEDLRREGGRHRGFHRNGADRRRLCHTLLYAISHSHKRGRPNVSPKLSSGRMETLTLQPEIYSAMETQSQARGRCSDPLNLARDTATYVLAAIRVGTLFQLMSVDRLLIRNVGFCDRQSRFRGTGPRLPKHPSGP